MKLKNVTFYNVPYDENCRKVPLYSPLPEGIKGISSTAVEGDIISPDRASDVWVCFKCPINYNKIKNCNYLSFVYIPSESEDKEETYKKYYAWIDKIIPESDDKYDYNSSTIINFHIDWWRSYIEDVMIKEGLILNRQPSHGSKDSRFNDPAQNVPCDYEYKNEKFIQELPGQTPGIAWIIISYLKKEDDKINKICYPINTKNTTEHIKFYNQTGIKIPINAPSLDETLTGAVIKALGTTSERVQGINISPIAPLDYEIDENGVLDFKWPHAAESFTYMPIDFIEKVEHSETESGRFKLVAYFANHENERLNGYENIDTAVQIRYFENGEYKEFKSNGTGDHHDEAEDKINIWLNRNMLKKRDYCQTGAHHIQSQKITEEMEYIPLMEYLKRYHTGSFYEIKTVSIPNDNLGCFKNKDLWKRERKYNAVGGIDYTEYEPQIFTEAPNITTIYNVGYDTYARTIDGNDKKINDYDVWIKNKETTFTITKENEWKTEVQILQDINCSVLISKDGLWPSIEKPLQKFASSDTATMALLDMRGLIIKKFSKKVLFSSVSCETITTGNSSSILIRFTPSYAAANDLEITLPCTPIESSGEYLHEYIVSGQRETDQQNLNLSVQQSLTSSMASTGLNFALGLLGGGVGVGLTAFSEITRGLLSSISQQQFGEERLRASEEALKRRGSFLIRQNDDYSWIRNGSPVCLTIIHPDPKSVSEYKHIIRKYGINVKEYRENITLKEGPLRVVDTLITGDAPQEAKDYIKNRLANGVYIDSKLTKVINKTEIKT